MHGIRLQRVMNLIALAWILVLVAVLVFGLLSGPYSGGEVAMQMFLLTFPASFAIGSMPNLINYSPSAINGNLSVFWIWLPYFMGALVQALVILSAVRIFGLKP